MPHTSQEKILIARVYWLAKCFVILVCTKYLIVKQYIIDSLAFLLRHMKFGAVYSDALWRGKV